MKCGETMNKKQNWVIIILFLVLIFGMTGVSLLKPDRNFRERKQIPGSESNALGGGTTLAVLLPRTMKPTLRTSSF